MTYHKSSGKEEQYIAPFVSKLIEMLNARDERSVVWSAGGRGFRVLDEEALERRALPRFFKDMSHPPRTRHRYASFRRQLNLYGFIKQRKGVLAGCYTHPCFRAGDSQLLALITRRKTCDQISQAADSSRRSKIESKIIGIQHDPRRNANIINRGIISPESFDTNDKVCLPMIFAAAISAMRASSTSRIAVEKYDPNFFPTGMFTTPDPDEISAEV